MGEVRLGGVGAREAGQIGAQRWGGVDVAWVCSRAVNITGGIDPFPDQFGRREIVFLRARRANGRCGEKDEQLNGSHGADSCSKYEIVFSVEETSLGKEEGALLTDFRGAQFSSAIIHGP